MRATFADAQTVYQTALAACPCELGGPIRQQLAPLLDLERHLAALLARKRAIASRKPGSRTSARCRSRAARSRVAACAAPGRRLDARESACDREVDRLIVAGLEVQELELAPAVLARS
jgi:hypothetical protein